MLELRNLSYHVANETGGDMPILSDINLTLQADSFVAITGPNGSGKSTLAKIIMGIEKPTSGQILFDGEDITDLSIDERAKRGIGFAFQQPVRIKGMRVLDLLRLAAGHPLTIEETCGYLSRVGLCAEDYVYREIDNSLSGGEIKRVEIAMLMARQVRLSLFDEPEAGIDLWSFQNLIQVFKSLRNKTKGTIVVISHQERILEIADRIIVIDGGRVTEDGPADAIMPHLMLDVDACAFYQRSVMK